MQELGWICAVLGFGPVVVALVLMGVALVVLSERVTLLQSQVRALRARLDALPASPSGVPAPAAEAVADAAPADAAPAQAPPPASEPATPAPADAAPPVDGPQAEPAAPRPRRAAAPAFTLPSPEKVAVWLGAGLGAAAVLFGVLFALVAVLEAGWFGPASRVTAGLVGGIGLWGLGAAVRTRVPVLGSALSGIGVGTLMGSLFAAHGYYHLLGSSLTFGLLVAVVIVATLRATVLSDRFMAHVGLLGGLLAPVLVSTGNNAAEALFAYLTVLIAGLVAAAGYRRWFDVVGAAALGAGALYLGWTARWHGPDSLVVALVAALALSLPFAAVASARLDERWPSTALRVAGVFGAALFPLLATPWILPIDPVFFDPRSGLQVVADQGPRLGFVVAALGALPLPLWLAARQRSHPVITVLGSGVAVWLLVAAETWLEHHRPVPALLVVGLVAPLAVGTLALLGRREAGWGLVPLPLVVGLLLGGVGAAGTEGAVFGGAAIALAVVSLGAALGSAPGATLLSAVVGLGVALAAGALGDVGVLWVLGPTLVGLGALSAPALGARWSGDRWPELPWLAGAIAGPVLFPALYLCWQDGLGDDVIGLLPVLVGVHGLLAAAVFVRVHRQHRNSPLLAVAVAVALAGVTFALPVQFQEKWLTVGWAVEGAALAWLATRLRHPLLRWGSAILGVVIAVRLLLNPWALAYGTTDGLPLFNWALYTWGVPTLCLLSSAWHLEKSRPEGQDWLGFAPVVLRVLAMLTGFALVNVEVSDLFQDAGPVELGGKTMLQGMARSLAWGGWGLFLLLLGLAVNSRYTRFVGFFFVLLGAGKVFVYDLWSLPGFVRVGSLLGLGFFLLVAAFVFERLVLRESPLSKSEST